MNFQERFPSDDDIWSYSNPTVAQQNAFKKYGKTAILYRSKAKNKKGKWKEDGYSANNLSRNILW